MDQHTGFSGDSLHNSMMQQQQQQMIHNSNRQAHIAPSGSNAAVMLRSSSSKHHGSQCGEDPSSSSTDVSDPPSTPLVLLVLWTIASAGYLIGYASGPNIADSLAFRKRFLLPSHVDQRFLAASGAPIGHMFCFEDSRGISIMLAVKYYAGCISSIPVGWITRAKGRRLSIWLGCAVFVVAHTLRASAVNWYMVLVGQMLDGVSCAFLYQSPYIEAVEIASSHRRGAFAYSEQIGRSIGVWSRSLLQEGLATSPVDMPWGWRLAVVFPVWPALVVMMLVPHIPETPNSLMQRGQLAAARVALQEIRGPLVNVEREFHTILDAAGISNGKGQSPLAQLRILLQVQQLPPLLLMLLLTIVREFTGGDFVLLYEATMQTGLGLTDIRSTFLVSQVVSAGYFAAAVLGFLLADALGRRPLLITSSLGAAGFFAMLAVVVRDAERFPGVMPKHYAILVHVSLIAAYTCYAFGWAGGYWLLMAELFPLATRSLATSVFVGLTLMMYGVSSSFALDWYCSLRYNIFWIYTGMNVLAVVLLLLLLPETRNVPLEDVHLKFRSHWFWKMWYKCAQKQPKEGQNQSQQQRSHHRNDRDQVHPPGQWQQQQQQAGHGQYSHLRIMRQKLHRTVVAAPVTQLKAVIGAVGAWLRQQKGHVYVMGNNNATLPRGSLVGELPVVAGTPAAAGAGPSGGTRSTMHSSLLTEQHPRQQQQMWGPPLQQRGGLSHTVSSSLNLEDFRYGTSVVGDHRYRRS